MEPGLITPKPLTEKGSQLKRNSHRTGSMPRVAQSAFKVRQVCEEIDFGLLQSKVGYRIREAYSHLFQTFTAMLKELRLAPRQYSALLLIDLNPGLSQTALAEATGLDTSTVVPIADRFVKLGWIRRTRRRLDRRFNTLRITPAGREVLDKARPIVEEHERQLVAKLSKSERDTLIRLLSRVTEGSERTHRFSKSKM